MKALGLNSFETWEKLSSTDGHVSEELNPQLQRCENLPSCHRIMADVSNKTIVLFALAAVLQHYLGCARSDCSMCGDTS